MSMAVRTALQATIDTSCAMAVRAYAASLYLDTEFDTRVNLLKLNVTIDRLRLSLPHWISDKANRPLP